MARMTCEVCDGELDAAAYGDTCPHCGHTHVATTSLFAPVSLPNQAAQAVGEPQIRTCALEFCGAELPADATVCPYCDTPVATAAAAPAPAHLLLPGGLTVDVGSDWVELGRRCPNPDIAAALNIHDRVVSRHHASVRVHLGIITVSDLSSSNGTFVNDERLNPTITIPLARCEIRLGSSVRIHLSPGAAA